MGISLVACVQTPNLGIGKDNDLLYKIPNDMKRFRDLTAGHPIIMGRKTYESIGRPLPKRTNIVISSVMTETEGLKIVWNISDAMSCALENPGADEVFVIGGEKIYEDFLPFANKMYLTLVEGNKDAEAYFPRWVPSQWEVSFERNEEHEGIKYSFVTYNRV